MRIDYEELGVGYAAQRRPDPLIEQAIWGELGAAATVLNVGAGAGSYEPPGRRVIAVEPSATMRGQRSQHLGPAIAARAECLPFRDGSFDASMAIATVHHWSDLGEGLTELVRVTRGPIIVLTFEGSALRRYWLNEYLPDLIEAEAARYPEVSRLAEMLGSAAVVRQISFRRDCTDGMLEAFYARPERLLDPLVRRSQSSWALVSEEAINRFEAELARDLAGGEWDRRYGHWRALSNYEGSLRLVVRR